MCGLSAEGPQCDRRNSDRLGLWGLVVLACILCVWIEFSDSNAKYVIYGTPALIFLTFVYLSRGVLTLDRRALLALTLYLGLAVASTLNAGYRDFFTTRDVLIIAGYLMLMVLAIRPGIAVVDGALAIITLGLGIEAANNGISTHVDFLRSGGILESSLAFPAGLVFMLYVLNRRWGRAALAAIILFITFKRIAFVGVFAGLAMMAAFAALGRTNIPRFAALAGVILASLLALFMQDIFSLAADILNMEDMSADSVSLGRAKFAQALWNELANAGAGQRLLGFGPGAADRFLLVMGHGDNPHNDWLKILFDYGLVGFVVMHGVLYLIFSSSRWGRIFYVYTAILMITDNVLIYMFYYAFVFFLLHAGEVRSATGRGRANSTIGSRLRPGPFSGASLKGSARGASAANIAHFIGLNGRRRI